MKENNGKRNKILAAVFAVLFAACVIWLVIYQTSVKKEAEKLNELKESYVEEPEQETTAEQEPQETKEQKGIPAAADTKAEEEEEGLPGLDDYAVPKKLIDFDALRQENEDIYAWIAIPGTAIDYPILQDPDEADYYLNHNLDGSSGYPGCIYTQYYNKQDWSDPNTVLYGHNMKDGSMFAALHHYKDPEFFEQNPYIYIYSKDKIRVYKIFAAYEYSDAHLLLTFDLESKEGYEDYLNIIFENTGINDNFDQSIKLDADSRIISLETCIGNKPTKRYLVQAVLCAEGEAFVIEE